MTRKKPIPDFHVDRDGQSCMGEQTFIVPSPREGLAAGLTGEARSQARADACRNALGGVLPDLHAAALNAGWEVDELYHAYLRQLIDVVWIDADHLDFDPGAVLQAMGATLIEEAQGIAKFERLATRGGKNDA